MKKMAARDVEDVIQVCYLYSIVEFLSKGFISDPSALYQFLQDSSQSETMI
jgi:hypothetical protein